MFACLKARPIRRGLQIFVATLGLLSLSQAAQGASPGSPATSSFTVQVQINATCTINSAGTLSFPSQTFIGANVDQTSIIQVTCTNTTPYTIGLDAGTSPGATVTTRKMTSSGNTVSYALYSDTNHTINWGNTPGTDTVSGSGTASPINHTVYGRIPPQTPVPGAYSDLITVTVAY